MVLHHHHNLHVPPLDSNMGNNSLIYLQNNNISINCSVYSLTNGTIKLLDHYNQTWNNATNLHEFLPAYYITNCSIPKLINLVLEQEYDNNNLTKKNTNFDQSPYNQRDNGDTFVAILFTLCGSCVSCWMLSLLLYLTPKHKRKPWLTQFTTIFYSIVTSILLNILTKSSEQEYYNDNLDIIKLHQKLYNSNVYKILMVLTQVLTMSSWFQIIQKLIKSKFKIYTSLLNFFFMGLYLAVFTYYQVIYNTLPFIHQQYPDLTDYNRWNIVRAITRLIVVFWFLGIITYYTIFIKNPRKICYNRKLFPLALFVWFLFLLDIVLTILNVSLFIDKWLVRTWLILIPYLIEIILLTVIWEWIYNIWILEKRYELMNVLGRRISYEDVVSFKNSPNKSKSSTFMEKLSNWFLYKFKTNNNIREIEDEDSLKEFFTSSSNSFERTITTNTNLGNDNTTTENINRTNAATTTLDEDAYNNDNNNDDDNNGNSNSSSDNDNNDNNELNDFNDKNDNNNNIHAGHDNYDDDDYEIYDNEHVNEFFDDNEDDSDNDTSAYYVIDHDNSDYAGHRISNDREI
ncbi:uncharacterized protein KGF55_001841 [Candida pseudojiufengensis]|uniref:uncharacterized protein n=1 Tax=Candida pseudojiufengensis TaxID=497109 RepID=UPI0022247DCD|nr:uncharacterized protein KGF55_001841 [Candida pseudojiufengensis]KAI5964771.1 hypothetical protein KGF55_001841 [Candida pseudojiufengensis]